MFRAHSCAQVTNPWLALVYRSFGCVISSFHREADENCALLASYAGSSGNFLPKFRDNLSVFGFLAPEE